jgi:hypothetical protein
MWWVINATPRPLYPREWPSTHCTGGWVDNRASVDMYGKSRTPIGIRSPDRPARNQSLFLLSYSGLQTNPSAISSDQNSTHRSLCRGHGQATWSAQMLKGVRLKSRLLASRRLVIGLIIVFFLRIYPPVTPHRSASVRISDVVCVRTHRQQTSCLLWAANKLLVSVTKFPELAAQRTELRQGTVSPQ